MHIHLNFEFVRLSLQLKRKEKKDSQPFQFISLLDDKVVFFFKASPIFLSGMVEMK